MDVFIGTWQSIPSETSGMDEFLANTSEKPDPFPAEPFTIVMTKDGNKINVKTVNEGVSEGVEVIEFGKKTKQSFPFMKDAEVEYFIEGDKLINKTYSGDLMTKTVRYVQGDTLVEENYVGEVKGVIKYTKM